jgi:4-hydroxybenzoate polyprenyltransferase
MARESPRHSVISGAPPASGAQDRSLALGLLISLRPGQWTKNLIVFAGLIFGPADARNAATLFDISAVLRAGAAFAIFCLLSGVVYLVNDVADREADRLHPLKARRPIASGIVPPGVALAFAAVLAAGCLGAAFSLGQRFGLVALGYAALQTLYSGPLKHIVIIDVLTIAMGFVLRAVAGAVVIDVRISQWLLICTVLLALFIALSKRRHEIVLLADRAGTHRPILQEYSAYLLDQMIAVVTASTLMAYALYTVSPETVAKYGTDLLPLTLPFPLYGIFRYLYLVHQKEAGGSPAELLLTDRPLLTCVALWAAAVVIIIYHPLGL